MSAAKGTFKHVQVYGSIFVLHELICEAEVDHDHVAV